MLNIVSAIAPAMIEMPQPSVTTKKSEPNMPTTMEGRLESVSMAVEAALVTQLSGAYSTRKIAAPRLIGRLMSKVMTSI